VDTRQLEIEFAEKLAELTEIERRLDKELAAAEAASSGGNGGQAKARGKPTGRRDLRETNLPKERVEIADPVLEALYALRDFLYERVYESKGIKEEFGKAQRILEELWQHFHDHADEFRARHWPKATREEEGLDRAVGDFLCGMTDRNAMRLYSEVRLPRPWTVY
jgi:dGTPase